MGLEGVGRAGWMHLVWVGTLSPSPSGWLWGYTLQTHTHSHSHMLTVIFIICVFYKGGSVCFRGHKLGWGAILFQFIKVMKSDSEVTAYKYDV